MSTPTFDGTDLTSRGEQQTLTPPQTRTFTALLPGVEGLYYQENPIGGKHIRVTGLLAVAGNTPALAFSTLLGVIETMQGKQGLVKAFVGTGGQTYNETELMSYRAGQITTGPTPDAATSTSVCQVEAVLLHLVPSNVS